MTLNATQIWNAARTTLDDDDEDEDEATLDPTQQAYFKSLIAYIFGLAVCDEVHYMKNAFSMTTQATKELKVRSLVFLTGTLIINRAHDLTGLLTLTRSSTASITNSALSNNNRFSRVAFSRMHGVRKPLNV